MRYQIRIRGQLGRTMLAAFPDLHAQAQGEGTLLTGVLPDQAALHGVLARIEALGLELLEVRRLEGDRRESPSGVTPTHPGARCDLGLGGRSHVRVLSKVSWLQRSGRQGEPASHR
jgi:hypothetical protein